MTSTSPPLPLTFTKRKRRPEFGEGDLPRPHKIWTSSPKHRNLDSLSRNPEELDLGNNSSEDEDDYEPTKPVDISPPQSTSTSKEILSSIPPPPQLTAGSIPHNKDEVKLDDDSSEDDYQTIIPVNKTDSTAPCPPPITTKRILGPAPPPAPVSEMPTSSQSHAEHTNVNLSVSSDSDSDDYGPSLPPLPGSKSTASSHQSHNSSTTQRIQSPATVKPQRESWMLVPPSALESQHRVDPTRLKSRKFASGKGAGAASTASYAGGGGGISAIWTETPEEKRRRVEDEVLGRRDIAARETQDRKKGKGKGDSKEDREERAMEERIRRYNEKNRATSLMDEHTAKVGHERSETGELNRHRTIAPGDKTAENGARQGKQVEKEDDPSSRAFDREKDMALGGRLGHAQKREMLTKARDFGGRFERGKFL